MGQTLYLECNMGISGDMAVAALIDLGADEGLVRKVLGSMPLSGFEIEISRVKKAGLDVCDFNVKLDEEHENHDHDMEYLHGHEHHHTHEHIYEYTYDDDCHSQIHEHTHDDDCHSQIHEHTHDDDSHSHIHGHDHEDECNEHTHRRSHNDDSHEHIHGYTHNGDSHEHNHVHSHEHRNLSDIRDIISRTDMSERAKNTALRIFDILAHAEAKAHGVDIDHVHFHEVGAVDSIVDIVAAAVCLDNLDVTEVIVPYLCEGSGSIRCQHGILPVPVPAVANIVQMNGLPLRLTGIQGELVTPTGAAIVAAVRNRDKLPEQFTVSKAGMGGGKRTYERPSILRAMLIKEEQEQKGDSIYKLETNIDDCTGEMLGYVMERLFENGAADVSYTPVFMKKNRPAYLLTVLCAKEYVDILENIIFRETTTIGIRKIMMERSILERDVETVQLPIGEIKVKKCTLPDGMIRRYPEYETVAHLAGKTGRSIQDILTLYHKYEGELTDGTNE